MKKKCTRCKEIKPTSDFNKDKSKKDGIYIYCRLCTKEIGAIQRQRKDYRQVRNKSKDRERRNSPQGRLNDLKYQLSDKGIETRKRYLRKKIRDLEKEIEMQYKID